MRLTWTTPALCPDEADLMKRIRDHLGREQIDPDPNVELQVTAIIVEDAGRYELSLEITSPAGSTGVDAGDPTCEVLAELVAIKVSLALDPVETARHLLPVEDAVPVVADAVPVPVPVAEPAPAPAPRFVLQVGPIVGGGILPSVEAGGFLGVGVAGRLWMVTLGASAMGGPNLDVSAPPGAGVGFWAAMGELSGCALPATRKVIFPACLEVVAGAVVANGYGLAVNRRAAAPIVAAGVATGLSWPADARVRLMIRARARVDAVRPSIGIGGLGEVHRSGIVSGQALVGMELVPRR